LLKALNTRLQADCQLVSRDVTLKFVSHCQDTCDSVVSAAADSVGGTVLTVLTDSQSADQCTFSHEIYRQHLTTRLLGNVVLYADVTTTTMHVIDW